MTRDSPAAGIQYPRSDTRLTLAEGLHEYYTSRNGLVDGRGASPEAREFFRCHDVAHVVFGCTTTLQDEAVVKIWSFLGTTAGLRLIRAYRLPEAQEIYVQLQWGEIVRTAFRSFLVIPIVEWRCFRMRDKWPWSDIESHLGQTLSEIRREFGIRPLRQP